MKTFSIDETDKLYQCARNCQLYKHQVRHTTFRDFCTTVRSLENATKMQEEDYWQELLQKVKFFRFMHYAAPIPINYQANELLQFLEKEKKNCQRFFPNFFLRLQELVDRVSALLAISDNPLLEKILELTSYEGSAKHAILLKEAYLLPTVEELVGAEDSLQQVEFVNKYQLRGSQCYQKLFVVGPHYWFPEYIFRAPRAEEIHYIHYSWISDTWEVQPVFIKPTRSQSTSKDVSAPTSTFNDNKSEGQEQGEVPEINWHILSAKVMKSPADDRSLELVPSRLYLLAGDHAVFLETNEHARVLTLDLEAGEDGEEEEMQQVRRVPISKLQVGMFLLLRTEGGGDYIIPIANRLLAGDAIRFREIQEQWKSLLRKQVDERGLLAVCIDLLDLGGSKHISEINLRYWISSKCIRPQNDDDFSAIMKLVGLAGNETLYQDVANKIESAHRRAGKYIRELLIKQVSTANLHEIHKQGYREFELPRSDGGSLTAFRIEHISPLSTTVSASRIGRPVSARNY